MVSLRNYFTMAMVICMIFCMFQFSGVASELLNDYGKNPYAENLEELPGRDDAFSGGQSSTRGQGRILYIGAERSPAADVAQNWAAYRKRDIWCCSSVQEYKDLEEAGGQIEFDLAVIDSDSLDWGLADLTGCLKDLAQTGTDLIFANLPDVSVIEENKELQQFLGISGIREQSASAVGVYLYGGFLLGGETIYRSEEKEIHEKKQDMELEFPWYELAAGTVTYMTGIMEDKEDYLDYPPVIWRNRLESSFVFAVNGDYMEGVSGLGLLSAMSAKVKEYEIYPVVNAQNLMILNYPGLAEENETEMRRRYNRSSRNVFRDVMWPDIVTAYEKSNLGLSAMMAPQYDYKDTNLPEQETLALYMKLLNERNAEAGLSGLCMSDGGLEERLEEDEAFFREGLPDYRFTSFYAAGLPEEEIRSALGKGMLTDVRTVVEDDRGDSEIIGYLSDQVTRQVALSDGLRYTYRQDFQNKCAETALGYSSVWVDAAEIIYPEDDGAETWREVSKNLAGDLSENWKELRAFSRTTVSECDVRIRNFLSMEYQVRKEGDQIFLESDNGGETAWFIFRMNTDFDVSIEGGRLEELEEGIYLIETQKEKVTLTLSEGDSNEIFR